MNTWAGKLLGWLLLAALFSFNAAASTYYVNVSNTVPVSPFTGWSTAATNIQDAIDVSSDGDLILVTNGVYATGGRVVYGSMTNRVVINKAITVQSMNGPDVTTIRGNSYNSSPSTPIANWVRCVYLTNSTVLNGFKLLSGGSSSGGGGGAWCESTSSLLINCSVTSNTIIYAGNGAGVYSGTLSNCTLFANDNPISAGGGSYASILHNCIIMGNYGQTPSGGGGAANCILDRCVIASNSIGTYAQGGGVYGSSLTNCILVGNKGGNFSMGGGASQSQLNSCLIVSNTANLGGGAYNCLLNNCTIIKNSALGVGADGGGVNGGFQSSNLSSNSILKNCILYYNNSPASGTNFFGAVSLNNCCTWPMPINGIGNFTNAPLFVNFTNDFHLLSNAPCINAGNNIYVSVTNDLDSNPRIVADTVDLGAYEFQSPASTLSYAWAQQYGLPTDGTADNADTDGDQTSNFAEWKSGTIPTNAASVLQLASPTNSVSGMVVTWQSVSGITYYLQRSSDLSGGFLSIISNLVGQAVSTSYTDTTATNDGPYFYRVGVQ